LLVYHSSPPLRFLPKSSSNQRAEEGASLLRSAAKEAPQHAKLITVMEDEAFASTSQSSHA